MTKKEVDFAMLDLPTIRRTPEEAAARRDLAERREAAASEAHFRAQIRGADRETAKREAAAAAGRIRE